MEESRHDVLRAPQSVSTAAPAGKFPYPVVGICGIEGDVPSLVAFFANAVSAKDMAFVVVLANRADGDALARSVRAVTTMPVTVVSVAKAPLSLQRDHIYIIMLPAIPLIGVDTVMARDGDLRDGVMPKVDLFLRGLAGMHRERAMAVILGNLGKGAVPGIADIKAGGGIAIAEAQTGASPVMVLDGMSDEAPYPDGADFILPATGIPAKLAELWRHAHGLACEPPCADAARVGHVAPAGRNPPKPEEEKALQEILAALLLRTGHDFSHYKIATILRRIERRMQIHGLATLAAYQDFIAATPAETRPLLQDLLIGVTHFFRDRDAFAALQRDVVPLLFNTVAPNKPLRVWIPGCSTGEEAYSIAILLRAHADDLGETRDMQLFATDINAQAVGYGRAGMYPDTIAADLRSDFLLQHFHLQAQQYQISKSLRKLVLFAQHDLLRDPPFAHLDLVSCRNLLIYLDHTMQLRVLQLFHFALRPGGYLFLGSAENVDAAPDLFEPVDKQHRIFRSKWRPKARRPILDFSISPMDAAPVGIAAPATPQTPETPPLPATPVGALHERTMLRYGPPSIMVNHQYDVLHISERATRYLRHIGGEPSQWLPDIVRPELRTALRAMLNEAVYLGDDVTSVPVELLQDGRPVQVAISVYPVAKKAKPHVVQGVDDTFVPGFLEAPRPATDPLALVVFHETAVEHDAPASPRNAPHTASSSVTQQVVDELERELRDARSQVRATLAHAEGSSEALKASNEELQAMNEELHSTTEELETSKEELQSINEELLTVNAELQAKIMESGNSNDDLTNLISSSNIATLFVDRSMVLRRYTPAAATLFHVIDADIGRSLLDITHRLDYPDLARDATAAFDSLKLIEKEVAGPDGRWYLSRLSPYRTTQDRIDGAVLTLVDITSRREAQEKMRTSEKRMQLVVQSTNDYAIIIHDMSGAIVTWNKGAERMFGYTEAETLGQSGGLIYTEEDRLAGVDAAEVRRALAQGRSQDEGWLMRKDGTRLYCSGVTTALHSDDFHGYAKIARDLTDGQTAESAKQLQISLERSVRKQVNTANRLKDEFLAVLSHELKNPLNLIHVKAEMLSRAPDARDLPVVQEASDAIRRSVAAQAKIIDDLLDLSRVRTGKLTLSEEAVDVARIIDAAVDALEGDAAVAGLTLTASGTRKPAIMVGDDTRIEQIVWNLLSNALKFTPAGGRVEVILAVEGDYFCISVTDTGQGIDPVFLPHIFDMFSQAESAFNRARGGLGIGLALVQQLSQMHGGHVLAESEGHGRGACFRVWLPRSPTDTQLGQPRPPVDAAVLREKKILLVDDTLETLEAFRTLLELEGAQVRTESNGVDALRATAEERFDVVLSDIGMPGMDGYEFVRALRGAPATATIPAVAMTGFGRAQDVERALEAGFNTHLGKPVSLDALLGAIRDVLAPPG
ncbi:MAG: CheR family methyltransferase [Janthinobacterium lividum]